MEGACRLILGIISAVVLCKYSQADWNTTRPPTNTTVSCHSHRNCSDEQTWSGHFSPCPEEYQHYCFNGDCRFVKEQNTPACVCELGYIGSRCEYIDLDYHVEERRKIVIACVVAGLVLLILLIVFMCVCTHKRYKPCRKKRRKEEISAEEEKLRSLNGNEASAASIDLSVTHTV